MEKKVEIIEGAVFEIAYPFVLDDYEDIDEEGPHTVKSWRPGVRYEQRTIHFFGDVDVTSDAVCDGMGKQLIRVISTHKPGRFPMRVFYIRQWLTPTNRLFGKTNCRVASIAGFRNLIKGYRHEIDRVGSQHEVAA